MAGNFNYTWVQGEDLDIKVTYKKGDPNIPEGEAGAVAPVDLTGWEARLSIGNYGTPILNIEEGAANVSLGADGVIEITLPRSELLEGGTLYPKLTQVSQNTFGYDLFVRDPGGKPFKVLSGQIYVERSIGQAWT